jgi:RNA polymerase sigma factor (sigma-70 family)
MLGGDAVRGRPAIRGETGAGPPRDVEALYARYREPLLALCLARLGDRSLAEDVVQDVFAKALVVLPGGDDPRPPWPLLASIAARDCIDAHRRRLRAANRQGELAAAAVTTCDDAARTALGRMAQEAVSREIEALPPRQRAALLFAVEGWTYADIAERLGCSVGAVKLLIVRARERLREARARVLSGLVPAVQGLLARMQGLLDRAATLAPWLERMGGSWLRALDGSAAVVVAVAGVLALSPPSPSGPVGAAPASSGAGPASRSVPAADAGRSTLRAGAGGVGSQVPPEPMAQAHGRAAQQAVDETAAALSSSDAEPRDRQTQSLTVSPGYHTDRTVFAVDGTLSVTRDGGASWSRLRALGLGARRILLPPAYPHDGRIFAFGQGGLQLSDDDGDSFQAVVPGNYMDAALSPGFDNGDPTVLLVSERGALVRYDGRDGWTEPVLLDGELAGHVVTGVGFDGADPEHRTIRLVSDRYATAAAQPEGLNASLSSSYLSECVLPRSTTVAALAAGHRPTCTTTRLPAFVSTFGGLALPPMGTGALFLRGQHDMLVSTDGGRTLRQAAPWGGSGRNRDVAAVDIGARSLVVARSSARPGPALLWSDDAGASWRPVFVDVPGFEPSGGFGGALAVAATPTGRILAGGINGGLACSVDDGRIWAPTCPTPDA